MIISEILLSYPCIQYDLEITHLTSRKSTALEWVILEVINKAAQYREYSEEKVADLFSQIFGISDCDMIVKPLLLQLQDIGAVKAEGVDDEASLSNIPMKNLSMTPEGKRMQRNGLLPGAKDEARIRIMYDIYSHKLVSASKLQMKSAPSGIRAKDIDAEDITFPVALVRSLLDEKKKATKGEKKEFNWLRETTEISDITPVAREECWQDVQKKIVVGVGGRCYIEGIEDDDLNTQALRSISIPESKELADAPTMDVHDPDEEFSSIIAPADIKKRVSSFLYHDDVSLLRESYYSSNVISGGIKNDRKAKVIVIAGETSEASCDIVDKRMTVYVPKDTITPDIVYLGSSGALHIGKISLSTNQLTRTMPIAFIPNNGDAEMFAIIIDIVNKYYMSDPSIILLISMLDDNSLLEHYIKLALKTRYKLSDKAALIDILNKASIALSRKRLIPLEEYESYIADEAVLAPYCANVDTLCDFIDELRCMTFVKQNIDMALSIIRKMVARIENIPSQLTDVWKLYASIGGIKPSFVKKLFSDGITKKFYTEDIIQQILLLVESEDVFNNDELMKEYTSVEKTLLDYRRLRERVSEYLPSVPFSGTFGTEYVREQLIKNKQNISQIYNEVTLWRELLQTFSSNIGNPEDYRAADDVFSNTVKYMDVLSDAVSLFFNDITKKFSTIYILDTCALMNEPEVMNEFDDGKALLIIPIVVLKELDHLKESSDEEKSFAARAAIRAIANHESCGWVDLREEAAPELLPNDLCAEKNDFLILSVANKYCVKQPTVITDDINMRNIAKALNIKTMDREGFHQFKRHTIESSKGKTGKKKK